MKQPTETAAVVLVNMPFNSLAVPSLGLSLLKAGLARHGVRARIEYCSLRFAAHIGEPLYTHIADQPHRLDLVGEWLFAGALFSDHPELSEVRYVEEILRRRSAGQPLLESHDVPLPERLIAALLQARRQVEPFLEDCVERILAAQPRIVGFTSVFQQQVPSLALAQRLKMRTPELHLVFGGANCEGEMGREVMQQFAFVDSVVSGEGDEVFPQLVRRVLEGHSLADLPGVFARTSAALPVLGSSAAASSARAEMDALPLPDFDDYFEQLAACGVSPSKRVHLLFETSRGCWWGAKHHCTFCGLNGETMAHRSKSAARALDELLHLTAKYPGYPVFATDNILDMAYFKDFLPALAERQLGIELFYEVKANLKKDQVRLLRAAGVTGIQPGIESLSDQVLRLMRKGVRGLQNVQLLKWCLELGVQPEWNFLWGFPGEAPEEYQRMAEMARWLTHLPPPTGAAKVRTDRFSPHYNEAEQFGFINLRPLAAYRHIYPFAPEVVARLAYFFDADLLRPQPMADYARPLSEAVEHWRATHSESSLLALDKGEQLLLCDTRPAASAPLRILTGWRKQVYLACDQISTPRQIAAWCRTQKSSAPSLDEIQTILTEFEEQGTLLRDEDAYLALAIAVTS